MKFGFDIDDTLINLREFAFRIYNKKLNQQIGLDIFQSLKTVEIHEPFGLTAEEGSQMWKSCSEEIYYTTCPPFPNAVETLQKLNQEGHEIYYITSRNKEHGERTKKWLVENGFPVEDDHFFCGMKDSEKVEIIQKLELDFYFDDKPEVLETLSKEPLKVYVMNQSYNQHLTFPRISGWSEFHSIIKTK